MPAIHSIQAQAEIFFQKQIPGHARTAQMAGNSGDHFAVEGFISVEKQRNPVGFRRFHNAPPFIAFETIVVSL
ncbi:hypothetical protein NX783_25800 [Massilia kyonggiensis]|nr:hypothetical protein [Massilia kyonggiensis]